VSAGISALALAENLVEWDSGVKGRDKASWTRQRDLCPRCLRGPWQDLIGRRRL